MADSQSTHLPAGKPRKPRYALAELVARESGQLSP